MGVGPDQAAGRSGPPPLVPMDLILHHDGRWTHEGQPILNRRIRECFDRSVAYLPDEGKYVVALGRFRGQVEVEEAGFFVREVNLRAGTLRLSSGCEERLDVRSLGVSAIDGALLCRVHRELAEEGLPARFTHAAQAELLGAVEERQGDYVLRVAGSWEVLPEL